MPKEYLTLVLVSRTYKLWVEADDEDDAKNNVYAMQTTDIAEQGKLDDVEIDNVEVIDEEERD